ncbi:MAG: butyrate kinase [Alkalispirochaeta sp.]
MPADDLVLAINPGSTSTKIAAFRGEQCLLERTVVHNIDDLAPFETVNDQLPLRKEAILQTLMTEGIELTSLAAVVGRGGLLHPVQGGTYQVNQRMLSDLGRGVLGEHASNLGGILAEEIARVAGNRPAYIVDPVVVDELAPEARPSGIPGLDRTSIFHALNQKAAARRASAELGTRYEDLAAVVVHLGGGITVGAHLHGRVIDVNDGLNGEGPFTPERSGGVAVLKIVDLCFSGRYEEREIRRMIKGNGGLAAYLGTTDGREIARRIGGGDREAERIYRAMAWQVAREIGAAAATLGVRPQAIILTGGLAHDESLTGWIRNRVEWMAPVLVYPGEEEMAALAAGARRVLSGVECALEYRGGEARNGDRHR